MKVDFGLLSRRLEGRREVGLLSSAGYSSMVMPVYDYIRDAHPSVDVFLLNGDEILCPLKTESFEFFVVLGVCCPIHPFKEFVSVANELPDEDRCRLERESQIVYDSTYGGVPGLETEPMDGEVLVVTRSQAFYDYYLYRYGASSLYPLEERDRLRYLSSRCNRGERIREARIFAVVFTSRIYEELARTIRRTLVSRRRNAYLLFLKDLSYERMITIEGTECIVVVDCPLFDCSEVDLHIPVVSPFEVEYALSNEWNCRFDKNSFDIGAGEVSGCTKVDLIGRVGMLLLKSSAQGVPFSYEEEDFEIHLGQSGTAQGYESEKHQARGEQY